MGALVQAKASRLAPLKVIEAPFQAIEAPSKPPVRLVCAVLAHEPHEFPEALTSRALPVKIRDVMAEFLGIRLLSAAFANWG